MRTGIVSTTFRPILRAAIAAAIIAAATSAQAAFDSPAVGAQATAMGGASLAGQGDSASMFLNPAGVAGLANPEAYFMYNQAYAGLSGVGGIGQGFAAVGVPTKLGDLGVGFSDLQASGLLEERVVGMTFSRRWNDWLRAGATAKYLYHRYLIGSDPLAAANPVFANGTSRSAMALDLGAIADVTEDLQVGLALRNVNQPDVGLASVDRIPREVQAGLAYRIKPWDVRMTADYTESDAPAGTLRERSQAGVGLEKSFQGDRVKFRIGATLDQFSGGIGLQFGAFGLDYAFVLARALVANNAGTHMIGLRYRFQ